jgi:hypothetical protein
MTVMMLSLTIHGQGVAKRKVALRRNDAVQCLFPPSPRLKATTSSSLPLQTSGPVPALGIDLTLR